MVIEVAPLETRRELDRLVTWGGAQRRSEPRRDALRARSQLLAAGAARAQSGAGRYLPTRDRKSDLERDFDALLAEHPEIPQPQRNIYIDGWEIDCYWPEQKLAVELDGRPYHIAVQDIEKDKYKDAKALIIGIRTLRVTDVRFNCDRAGVYDDLCAALGPS